MVHIFPEARTTQATPELVAIVQSERVLALADRIGSTSSLLDFVAKSGTAPSS
jgi:hypothetical protein